MWASGSGQSGVGRGMPGPYLEDIVGPVKVCVGPHTLTHNSQLLALGSSVFLGRYRRHLEDFPE